LQVSWPGESLAIFVGVGIRAARAMLNLQTLVLNADYRPLSFHPLSLWSWRDALTALMLDRVALVESYDIQARSPSITVSIPSVVALKRYRKLDGFPAFTRYNIYLRDAFTCQYCAHEFPAEMLTFDHIVPRSRGGRTTWENVVAACAVCNHTKGNRLPAEAKMPLLHRPRRPTKTELNRRAPDLRYRDYHHSWLDYLYWDSELDA
jgi:5-methylcytosine-specific restriction endonuclease McrA